LIRLLALIEVCCAEYRPLAYFCVGELSDPHFGQLVVTGAEVSRDSRIERVVAFQLFLELVVTRFAEFFASI
jgi:hypothetical protein